MTDWTKGKNWRSIAIGWWLPVPLIALCGLSIWLNLIIGIPLTLWAFWPTDGTDD